MEKKDFRWGYIGYGWIAEVTAKRLKEAGQTLFGVWGRNENKASAFAKKYGAKAYQTLEEMLLDPAIDGVYVATTNDTHKYYVEQCIARGKPVLCEKPFAFNARETEEVFALAKEKGVYISEAMWTWHNEVSLKVREWISSGAIGEVKSVKLKYAFPLTSKRKTTGRLVEVKKGGGALVDIGVYPVRYVYELFGLPESIVCQGDVLRGVDFEEKITMKYPSFTAELLVSMYRFFGEKAEIVGSEGKIVVPFFHEAKKAHGKNTVTGKRFSFRREIHPYARQFYNVAQEIQAGRKEGEKISSASTIDVMKLLDECRKQMGVVYPTDER